MLFSQALLGLALTWTPGADEYIVLSAVDKEDPYYEVAERIAKLHRTRAVLEWDPEHPEELRDELAKRAPRAVALVARPEQITVTTVRRFLRMSTTLDQDPFVDFDFGYLTGATPEEALAFVDNIAKAGKKSAKRPKQVGEAAVLGTDTPCSAITGTYSSGKLQRPSRKLYFTAPDGKDGRDQDFIDAELEQLEGCGAIIMGGHGMPWEICTGPRAEDVSGLELFPAVAFNYACHTGATLSYSEVAYVQGNYTQKLLEVERDQSFALAMIRAGVTGYTAYVNPRPAGPELTTDFDRVLAGASLGAARRNDYAKIVLGYLGFGEPGILVPDVEDVNIPAREVDAVRHMMLDEATGGILYGDPALQPYPIEEDGLPLKTAVQRKGKELHVTMTMEASRVWVWCADPFRWFDKAANQMAMKLYDRIELPSRFGEIGSVKYARTSWAGNPMDTIEPVWAVEEDQGKRYLHLKAGFRREQRNGPIEVEFVVSTEE